MSDLPWWVRPAMGIANIIVFVGVLIAACFIGTSEMIAALIGVAATNATSVVTYYFGSSHSAETKSDV